MKFSNLIIVGTLCGVKYNSVLEAFMGKFKDISEIYFSDDYGFLTKLLQSKKSTLILFAPGNIPRVIQKRVLSEKDAFMNLLVEQNNAVGHISLNGKEPVGLVLDANPFTEEINFINKQIRSAKNRGENFLRVVS